MKEVVRADAAGKAFRIGYEALGPVFSAFGRLVLLRAGRFGVRRLYFVARDGDLLRSVVGRIGASRTPATIPESRYLLASRRSSQLPAMDALELDLVRRIGAEQPGEPDLHRVFGALNLDSALFNDALLRQGLAGTGISVGDALADGRLSRLLADDGFRRTIEGERVRQKGLLRRYLEQEGLFDGVPSALVDVGWRGTIQSNLEDAFGDDPAWGHPRGLYVGTWDDPVLSDAPRHLESKDGLVGDSRRGWSVLEAGVHHAALLLEAVCRAPHGTVLGYRSTEDGRIEPLLAEGSESRMAESAAEELLSSVRAGIVAHAEEASSSLLETADEKTLRRQAQKALLRVGVFPTPDELRILGRAVHTEGFDPAWSAALVPAERVSPVRSPRRWAFGLRSPWRAGYVAATGGRAASGAFLLGETLLQKLPRRLVAVLRHGALRWTRPHARRDASS